MNITRYLVFCTAICTAFDVHAQSSSKKNAPKEANYEVYMAQYEEGAGSTIFNDDLKAVAPVSSQPFVVITGVKFKDCENGFPTESGFTQLYGISDAVKAVIDKQGVNSPAGTFTYQCERLDYYYISDTVGLRKQLLDLYAQQFSGYEPYVNIKPDKDWDAYLKFLYPNEDTWEYIRNEKVIMNLVENGDKLEQPRRVDHWIYFKTEKDLAAFEVYAIQHGFKTESRIKNKKEKEYPLGLQIYRNDKVSLDEISQLTILLKKQAVAYAGYYDGWETEAVK